MRAVQISRYGGPEELRLVDLPDPLPGPGEVLVRNGWIGVNYVDLQHRAGRPYPVDLPLIPGTEAAGVVTETGAGVDPGLAGAPVVHFGHLRGVYAELTAVPAEFVVPLPAGVALDDAAAVAMNGTTAYVLTAMACQLGARASPSATLSAARPRRTPAWPAGPWPERSSFRPTQTGRS